jgi:hypothetical protein
VGQKIIFKSLELKKLFSGHLLKFSKKFANLCFFSRSGAKIKNKKYGRGKKGASVMRWHFWEFHTFGKPIKKHTFGLN